MPAASVVVDALAVGSIRTDRAPREDWIQPEQCLRRRIGKLKGQSEESFQRLSVQDGAGQRAEFLLISGLVHGPDTPDLGIGDVLLAGDHPAIVEMQFESPAQGGPLRWRLPVPGLPRGVED